jgi:hypothetical protein
MLRIATLLFAIGAVGGVILATLHLKKKDAPVPLAIVHGLLAATGLVLLIIAVSQMVPAGLAGAALGVYLVAALGGFVLFARHLQKKTLPPTLIVLHGLLAVSATVLLWASQMKG